jgi:hypothetical protein
MVGGEKEKKRASLLVLLHALESLFKLRDQRSFAGLQTVACETHTRPCQPLVDAKGDWTRAA